MVWYGTAELNKEVEERNAIEGNNACNYTK